MTPKSLFVCQACGNEFAKWSGQCSACKEWNTLVETAVFTRNQRSKIKDQKSGRGKIEPTRLSSLSPLTSSPSRIPTGLSEFDQVLSGGLIPGQVVLLAGEPGIGKSTLLLQVAAAIENGKWKMEKSKEDLSIISSQLSIPQVLYVCGEESPSQIQLRAQRLAISDSRIALLPETDVDALIEHFANRHSPVVKSDQPKATGELLIVDSIQTLTTADLAAGAGSVAQVKESARRLTRLAKEKGIPTILVGHVNKEGDIAGPKVLEHLVDTVLYFEGERTGQLRILRAIKNRFGQVGETGVFEMTDQGFKEVPNPSARFLSQSAKSSPGSVLSVVMEGSRPLLVEIQALAVRSSFNYPRRTATGFDLNRLYFLCAVIEKHLKIPLSAHDVYVNVTSGLAVDEPAADLPVALALVSSAREPKSRFNLPKAATTTKTDLGFVAYGEVGLAGEVRPVSFEERRAKEAVKLGFTKILSPQTVKTLREAVREALGG